MSQTQNPQPIYYTILQHRSYITYEDKTPVCNSDRAIFRNFDDAIKYVKEELIPESINFLEEGGNICCCCRHNREEDQPEETSNSSSTSSLSTSSQDEHKTSIENDEKIEDEEANEETNEETNEEDDHYTYTIEQDIEEEDNFAHFSLLGKDNKTKFRFVVYPIFEIK